jgi:hypothetical protein
MAKKRLTKTLCQDPFEITEAMAMWLREKFSGITKRQVIEAHDEFMDWIRAKQPMYYDWVAVWRNSMRRKFSAGYRQVKTFQQMAEEEAHARIAARNANVVAINARRSVGPVAVRRDHFRLGAPSALPVAQDPANAGRIRRLRFGMGGATQDVAEPRKATKPDPDP